jgi:hypothetical protein
LTGSIPKEIGQLKNLVGLYSSCILRLKTFSLTDQLTSNLRVSTLIDSLMAINSLDRSLLSSEVFLDSNNCILFIFLLVCSYSVWFLIIWIHRWVANNKISGLIPHQLASLTALKQLYPISFPVALSTLSV